MKSKECATISSKLVKPFFFGISNACPGVTGKASRMASECSVSNILNEGIWEGHMQSRAKED